MGIIMDLLFGRKLTQEEIRERELREAAEQAAEKIEKEKSLRDSIAMQEARDEFSRNNFNKKYGKSWNLVRDEWETIRQYKFGNVQIDNEMIFSEREDFYNLNMKIFNENEIINNDRTKLWTKEQKNIYWDFEISSKKEKKSLIAKYKNKEIWEIVDILLEETRTEKLEKLNRLKLEKEERWGRYLKHNIKFNEIAKNDFDRMIEEDFKAEEFKDIKSKEIDNELSLLEQRKAELEARIALKKAEKEQWKG